MTPVPAHARLMLLECYQGAGKSVDERTTCTPNAGAISEDLRTDPRVRVHRDGLWVGVPVAGGTAGSWARSAQRGPDELGLPHGEWPPADKRRDHRRVGFCDPIAKDVIKLPFALAPSSIIANRARSRRNPVGCAPFAALGESCA